MKALIILALLAPPDSSMLAISGASSLEELDETQVEMYQHLESHPVNLNTASRRQLTASGLLTPYQTASLLEYRASAGDILSLAELAAVDGFGEGFVRALSPYISLRSRAPAGESSSGGGITGEASARMWAKTDDGSAALSYGGKMKIEAGTWLSAAAAFKRSYAPGLSMPEVFNWSAALYGRRIPATLIVGDFNARFGQGLLSWSGFSLSGLSSISSFYKRPSGLSPSFSYTKTGLRGAAAEVELGAVSLSATLAMPPRKGKAATALAGLCWYGLKAQAGLNATYSGKYDYGLSADFRLNAGKTDIFGEAAWRTGTRRPEGLAGAVWNIEYDVKLAGRAVYQQDKATAAIGGQYRQSFASVEGILKKDVGTVKYLISSPIDLSDSLSVTLRLKGRLEKEKGAYYAVRGTFDWTGGRWKARLLADLGKGSIFACLFYLEPGYVSDKFSLYARATLFACDNWDERIYIYERDAPGNFNMKAYYGRGWAASAVAGWKIKKQRVHLRASLTDSSRGTRMELHGQYSIEF
jgi:hypothetical protein